METTAMRAAAVRADAAGSSPDAPTQPIGLTDPLSLSPAAKASVQILIVDDERTLRESCASMLKHEGYNVRVCSRGEEALETLKRVRFDIVLLDLYMAQVQGMELLRVTLETHPETIVIVMTGHPSVTSNLEALQAGAWDYLPKPFSATHMQILVGRAAHAVMVARETRELQAGNSNEGGTGEKVPLIGVSPSFRRAIDLARRVASTDASVFITGESGVGKEQIAQFIHNHSRRSSRPLVAINCAALPEALLESEMFGHVKGAFTGAVRDKPGLLEMANGGTLFLDELIEMSKPIQAKLLRAIQDGVVRRVGSERTDAVVNVRFIACTNCNPEEALRSGQLREDLYYRLRVVPIQVPPLRDRPEDIPLLATHFLAYYWRRHRESDAPLPKLSETAVRELRSRHSARRYPGDRRPDAHRGSGRERVGHQGRGQRHRRRLSCDARALARTVRAPVSAATGDAGGRERFPSRPDRAAESDDPVPPHGAVRIAAQAPSERSRRARGVARCQVILSCGWIPRGW